MASSIEMASIVGLRSNEIANDDEGKKGAIYN